MFQTVPAPRLRLLSGADEDVAFVTDSGTVSYAQVAQLAAARRHELGSVRRLVMLEATNAVESIVTYLAALEGGHPVLLVPPGDDEASRTLRASLADRFNPDVFFAGSGGDAALREIRPGSAHSFADDLALLVSTSGSTGTPKLVRLSRQNVLSNAHAIASYLRLTPADRAVTTLPLHYCYGLSVLNSHLVAGASVVLTERSVADAAFWDEAATHRITSIAGVPYTFELLEAGQFTDRLPASIRYLTQAGGRLAPDAVRRFARLGERRGFQFFVMYGQTEATARMAYVPAEFASHSAGAIGRAIPGGRLRIDAAPGTDVGELVYQGPNVMLGYAETPADFALGRSVHELRTGDLARHRDDGMFEVVGRLNRFVKVYGLRVDLDSVQRLLTQEGFEARTASTGEDVLVFVRAARFVDRARTRAAALLGIPAHAIRVYPISEFPHTVTGKPDFAALVRYAEMIDAQKASVGVNGGQGVTADMIRDLFIVFLERPDATINDSFAGLGGDSLSYVEVTLRLEDLLGALPRNWPSQSAQTLASLAEGSSPHADRSVAGEWEKRTAATGRGWLGRFPRVETPAVLRAVAIVLIVATHADLITLKGGAHLLLAVAGYNLARFQLANVAGATRVRRLFTSAAQIAVPAGLWIGAVAVFTGKYTWTTTLLVNNIVPGDGGWNEQWQFWFLEAAVWTILGLAAMFLIRPIDRLERRHPWMFSVALFVAAVTLRFALVGIEAEGVERYAVVTVLWSLVLGWVIARADSWGKRLAVSVAAIVATAGFFGDPAREAVVVGGILLLIWVQQLRIHRALVPAVRLLASASLFIYLTHWVVYPAWEISAPWFGTVLSLAIGVAAWYLYRLGGRALNHSVPTGIRGQKFALSRRDESPHATD